MKAAKAVENRWSRRQLRGQIDLKLHLRYRAATANYARALTTRPRSRSRSA